MENKEHKSKERRPGRKTGVKVKHGAYSLIARGALPRKRKYLESFLSKVRERLIEDLGPGEESLTAAQLILIDRVIGKLGICRCIEEFCKEEGIMQGKTLSPILRQSYISYSNSIRHDLAALGIDKRKSENLDLHKYIKETYGGKDETSD